MRRISIRWLLLGVAAASLLLPVLTIISLRSFDALLIRQTEKELSAQGALVAAAYQEIWGELKGERIGNPRDRWHSTNSFTPLSTRLDDLDQVVGPAPDPLPLRTGPSWGQERGAELSARLSRMLKNAQVFNLSGVRVLDETGCALASSRGQIDSCFHDLPEVQKALLGVPSSVLRRRVSDEPPPPLSSFRRGGYLRVFVSLPVWNDEKMIGVVLLSRTAESGLEWLFKQRRDVFYGGLAIVVLAALISFVFSLWITRPLERMAKMLRKADGTGNALSLGAVSAPYEIHTLGVALDERAAELERKNGYVTEFAANVSHELKTPLTSIRGAVELLKDPSSDMDEVQRRRFLSNIDDAAARTSRLVTRLLKLARLEASPLRSDEDEISLKKWADDFPARYGASVELKLGGSWRPSVQRRGA